MMYIIFSCTYWLSSSLFVEMSIEHYVSLYDYTLNIIFLDSFMCMSEALLYYFLWGCSSQLYGTLQCIYQFSCHGRFFHTC